MRNILEKVRKPDYEAVKVEAQAIYGLAHGRFPLVVFSHEFWPSINKDGYPQCSDPIQHERYEQDGYTPDCSVSLPAQM